MQNVKAKITIDYTTCCFCDKLVFPCGEPVDFRPRFNFRKAVREYAINHGLTVFQWGKYKTALAYTNQNCSHFDNNIVRLDWTTA